MASPPTEGVHGRAPQPPKVKEPNRPGFAAYGGANAFEPPLGKPLAGKKSADRGAVGGGVISRAGESAAIKADRANPKVKRPDLADSMKRMLRRK